MNKLKLLSLIGFASIIFVPDFLGILIQYSQDEIPQDWDNNNMLLWGYGHDSGYSIYKDFWFPYGGSIIFTGRSLQAITNLFLYKIAVITLFGIIVYKIVDKNTILTLMIILVVVGGELYITDKGIPLFWGLFRYILSISLTLSYIIAINGVSENKNSFVIFNLLLIISFLTYIDQLLISFVPILSIFIIYIILNRKFLNIKKLFSFHLASLFISLVFLSSLIINEQLVNFYDFYSNIGNNSISSTEPFQISFSLNNLINYQTLIIFIPAIFFGLSVLSLLSRNKNDKKILLFGYINFGLCMLTLMVLMKYSIRDMRYQLMIFPVLLSFFYIYQHASRKIILNGVAVALIIYFLPNYFSNLFNIIFIRAPSIILKNINNIDNIKQLAETDFSERYKFSKTNQDLKNSLLKLIGNESFYVLGEPSNLYIIGGMEIPYFTSFYDGSSIQNQKKLIKWLNDKNINYVIVRKNFTSFDLVDNTIRVPLVFDFLIQNFTHEFSFSNYDILKRSSHILRPDYKYWSGYLGTSLNFGYLAESIKVTSTNCQNEKNCTQFIHISKLDADPGSFNIQVLKNSIKMNLKLDMHSVNKNAYININRLWFANFFESKLIDTDIFCLDKRLTCKIINAPYDSEFLY